MYSTVKQILASKGHTIHFVKPTDTLETALRLMAEKEVGALLVMEDNNIVGIFSERDFARKVLVQGLAKPTTKISQMMSPEVLCISPDRTMPDSKVLDLHRIGCMNQWASQVLDIQLVNGQEQKECRIRNFILLENQPNFTSKLKIICYPNYKRMELLQSSRQLKMLDLKEVK